MPDPLLILSSSCCLAWFYLLLFHHNFWRADQQLESSTGNLDVWPNVAVVVPARNEADVIERTLSSLADQDYPGSMFIYLVDDNSEDGTGDVARGINGTTPIKVLSAPPLRAGWTGKLAALQHGIAAACEEMPACQYLLLTDADIEHPRSALWQLVRKSETDNLDLTSLMVRLHCRSLWERLLVPAFVFFFQKLYPFPAVNDHQSAVAGAAGGVMLVRRNSLEKAGGLEAIKDAVIDDCTLAALLKRNNGRIWLGLAKDIFSIRPYDGLADIWNMVARTAFTELNYAYLRLLGAILGMMLVYLSGPLLLVLYPWHEVVPASSLGLLAWLLMTCAYIPTILYYRVPIIWAIALPLVGFLYTLMTIDSALRHLRNRGSGWKGRTYSS